jgi:hypothetical protein
MTRSDRSWTAVVAECGLDRARPLLAQLAPRPFARVNLARALAETGFVLTRNTPFADMVRPRLEEQLGPEADAALAALARLPLDDDSCPATVFWRGMFRDLHGVNRPVLLGEAAADWAAFIDAFRGRADPDAAPDWLQPVANDAQDMRDLSTLARMQRALPLTPHDRSLYVRFGWNDDGAIPGMAGLLHAAALLRTQRAWLAAAPRFDAASQDRIMAAAGDLVAAERAAALAGLDDEARRYGLPREQLAADLYPPRVVPPLGDIVNEAA